MRRLAAGRSRRSGDDLPSSGFRGFRSRGSAIPGSCLPRRLRLVAERARPMGGVRRGSATGPRLALPVSSSMKPPGCCAWTRPGRHPCFRVGGSTWKPPWRPVGRRTQPHAGRTPARVWGVKTVRSPAPSSRCSRFRCAAQPCARPRRSGRACGASTLPTSRRLAGDNLFRGTSPRRRAGLARGIRNCSSEGPGRPERMRPEPREQ